MFTLQSLFLHWIQTKKLQMLLNILKEFKFRVAVAFFRRVFVFGCYQKKRRGKAEFSHWKPFSQRAFYPSDRRCHSLELRLVPKWSSPLAHQQRFTCTWRRRGHVLAHVTRSPGKVAQLCRRCACVISGREFGVRVRFGRRLHRFSSSSRSVHPLFSAGIDLLSRLLS